LFITAEKISYENRPKLPMKYKHVSCHHLKLLIAAVNIIHSIIFTTCTYAWAEAICFNSRQQYWLRTEQLEKEATLARSCKSTVLSIL